MFANLGPYGRNRLILFIATLVLLAVIGLTLGGTTLLTITLLGGTLRKANASMVGELAEAALAELWFDQLFLGVSAVAPDLSIYSADEQEARINQLMLLRTAEPVILTDSSKFGQRFTHRVVPIAGTMQIITDCRLSVDCQRQLAEAGAALTLVEQP